MSAPAAQTIFASIFEGLRVVSAAASHCISVDIYPTKMRSVNYLNKQQSHVFDNFFRAMGVALTIAGGQIGMILGNLGIIMMFGLSCVSVVAIISFAMMSNMSLILLHIDIYHRSLFQFQGSSFYFFQGIWEHIYVSNKKNGCLDCCTLFIAFAFLYIYYRIYKRTEMVFM